MIARVPDAREQAVDLAQGIAQALERTLRERGGDPIDLACGTWALRLAREHAEDLLECGADLAAIRQELRPLLATLRRNLGQPDPALLAQGIARRAPRSGRDGIYCKGDKT